MRSGLKRCTCGSDQCPAARRARCSQASVWQMARRRVSLGTMDGQDPVDNLRIFAVPSPFPPLHTLGGGPRVDGERAGGISVKLGGEPCTSTAPLQVQHIYLWMEGLLCWL